MKERQWLGALACAAALGLGQGAAMAQVTQINEGFDAGVPPVWALNNYNLSDVQNGPGWYAGAGGSMFFDAHQGDPGSYLATSVFIGNTDVNGDPTGAVEALIYTSEVSLQHETTLSFWTRTVSASNYAETLYYGVLVDYVSDFTLGAINPAGDVGAYPEEWTQYSVTLPGLGPNTVGLFWFDYYIPDASVAGEYIGIDSVLVTSVPEPSTALAGLALLAAFGATASRRRRNTPML